MALAADTSVTAETRRDRWGRYLVVPPGSTRPEGYTRVTTVAKTLDDGGGLIPWKATLAMTGMLRRPGLRGRFEALLSQHPDTGPWYGTTDSKNAAKKLVEECAEAGGSSDRADVGTALHSMVEQHNRGQMMMITQPSTQADLDAYVRTVDAAGLAIDPTMIEATVVLDGFKVAGTADMLSVTLPGYGDLIADLKTGAELAYSWQSIAVQLAAYAHADAVYHQGPSTDGSEDERRPMPVVSRAHGLVIHLPAGEARCELHLIDIVAGWEAFERSMWTRKWRSRRDLATPYEITASTAASVGREAPATVRPVAGALTAQQQHAAVRTAPDEGGPADDAAVEALERAYMALPASARAWIKERVTEATQHGVSLHLKGNRTVRRFELVRALVTLAVDVAGDEEIRCILATIIGDPAHFPALTLGHLIGSLDATEAALFAERCDVFVNGSVPGVVDEATGRVVLVFDGVAA